jgi:alanine racemase
VVELLQEAPGWEGIFTHFHSADTDVGATRLQWARLLDVVRAIGRRPRYVHAANSGAGVADLGLEADFARPGIYLYGGCVGGHGSQPVAALRARVVATRRLVRGDTVSYGATWRADRVTTIASVAIGYGDGFPRRLGNVGRVEFDGAVFPIVGHVTMDLTMVDVGDARVVPGDVATLYGGIVSLDEQAAAAETIGYELLAALTSRVARRYRDT